MIFVDSGAFLGRFAHNDQHHIEAGKRWAKIEASRLACFTSNYILDETLTLLARRTSYPFAVERGRSLYSSGEVNLVRPAPEDELAAFDWFQKFADQRVSFTDCVSFVLMKKAGIDTAFSFDHHFERAGFKLWA